LVFGILSKMSLFGENSKGINAVLAIAMGLMALQFNMVSVFFSEIFPRMGVALSVILVLLVISGIFMNTKNKKFFNILMGVSLVIVAIVAFSSFDSLGFFSGFGGGYWWSYNWGNLLGIAIIVGLFLLALGPVFKKSENVAEHESILSRALSK